MVRSLERFFVVLLLAWLPIQAAAQPVLAAMLCEQSASHEACASAGGHDHPAGLSTHTQDDGDKGATGASHAHEQGCCHHLCSAMPSVSLSLLSESGSRFDPAPLSTFRSFLPAQPQRPPLA